MIDRYCFVRLREGVDRLDAIARFRDHFDHHPDVIATSAGIPADDSARSWDLGFVIRCADLDHLAGVLAAGADFFAWLEERAQVVKTWSFESA